MLINRYSLLACCGVSTSIICKSLSINNYYHAQTVDYESADLQKLSKYYKESRLFKPIKEMEKSSNKSMFRVMQYNILADGPFYALSKYVNYTPIEYRLWSYRWPRILAQILAYQPDIICMQETTFDTFNNDIKPTLFDYNYDGLIAQRGQQTLSLFYNFNKFKFINSKQIKLSEICKSKQFRDEYLGSNHMDNTLEETIYYKTLIQRPDIAIIAHLQTNDKYKKDIIVIASHLYWNHIKFPHIISTQILALNYGLYNLLKNEWNMSNIENVPIILGIDTNCSPVRNNGVEMLMTNQYLKRTHIDHPYGKQTHIDQTHGNGNNDKLETEWNGIYNINDWSFKSFGIKWKAYNEILTQKSKKKSGFPDYIFYSNSLGLKTYLQMPYCSDNVDSFPAIPNDINPSDHLPLVCDFQFL